MLYKNIIAILLLVIIVIYKIIVGNKYKKKRTIVARKEQIIVGCLMGVSLVFFILVFVLEVKKNGGNVSFDKTIGYFVNALTVALMVLPIDLVGLYKSMFNDEEKYCNVDTVVTDIRDDKLFKKFKKGHINVVLVTDEVNSDYIEEDKVSKACLEKSCCIKASNIHILDKWIDRDRMVIEQRNIRKLYEKIMNSRMVYDNYLRIFKVIIMIYLSLILSYILLTIEGFPFVYDLLLIVIVKVMTLVGIELVYKKLPYDKDVETRYVKDKDMFIGRQELLFTIAHGFINLFAMTIPYMLVLSLGGELTLAYSLYVLIFIFINIFSVYTMVNDSFIVKIVWNNIRNIRIIFYVILMVGLTFICNFTSVLGTINVGVKNYFSCMLFAIATISLNEFIKLARYISKKGKKKNGIKNNKKSRRS